MIMGVTLLGDAGFKYYDNLKKRVLPATIEFGDGVSKSTAKAVNAYEDMNIEVTAKLNTLKATNTTITNDIADDMSKRFKDMGDSLKNGYKTSANNATKVLKEFYASNNEMSDKEKVKSLAKSMPITRKNKKRSKSMLTSDEMYRTAARENRILQTKKIKK
ncbi:hypothetical protein ACO1DC_16080 [Bacillus velezensis]